MDDPLSRDLLVVKGRSIQIEGFGLDAVGNRAIESIVGDPVDAVRLERAEGIRDPAGFHKLKVHAAGNIRGSVKEEEGFPVIKKRLQSGVDLPVKVRAFAPPGKNSFDPGVKRLIRRSELELGAGTVNS